MVLVLLDACALYPPSLRDLLLTLAALDAFHVAWTDEILEGVRLNVVADHPDIDPDRFVSHTLSAMKAAFPGAVVGGYEHLIGTLENNPKDRHVAAAAIAGWYFGHRDRERPGFPKLGARSGGHRSPDHGL